VNYEKFSEERKQFFPGKAKPLSKFLICFPDPFSPPNPKKKLHLKMHNTQRKSWLRPWKLHISSRLIFYS